MPQLSRFFGIIISMYYDDHNPPHFHARYGDFEALVSTETGNIIEGKLPPRVYGLVMEWYQLHKVEIIEAWNNVRNNNPPNKIEPLT